MGASSSIFIIHQTIFVWLDKKFALITVGWQCMTSLSHQSIILVLVLNEVRSNIFLLGIDKLSIV
jgi:hypothetical protein